MCLLSWCAEKKPMSFLWYSYQNHILNLIIEQKHLTNPKWGTFYKIYGLYSLKMSVSWKTKEEGKIECNIWPRILRCYSRQHMLLLEQLAKFEYSLSSRQCFFINTTFLILIIALWLYKRMFLILGNSCWSI